MNKAVLWNVSRCNKGQQLDKANQRIKAVQEAMTKAGAAVAHSPVHKDYVERLKKELYEYVRRQGHQWPCPWGDPAPMAVEYRNFVSRFNTARNNAPSKPKPKPTPPPMPQIPVAQPLPDYLPGNEEFGLPELRIQPKEEISMKMVIGAVIVATLGAAVLYAVAG